MSLNIGAGAQLTVIGFAGTTVNLGNLTGSVALDDLIPGVQYKATTTGNVTALSVSTYGTGVVNITLSNGSGYTVAQPTMTGRTAKLLYSGAWDDAAGALVNVNLHDDGTYLIASATLLA